MSGERLADAGSTVGKPKRPGGRYGGRPKGGLNKLTRLVKERAMESGLLPHEILLYMARGVVPTPIRDENGEPLRNEDGSLQYRWEVLEDLKARGAAAQAAAPYFAPRLAAVLQTQTPTVPSDLEGRFLAALGLQDAPNEPKAVLVSGEQGNSLYDEIESQFDAKPEP